VTTRTGRIGETVAHEPVGVAAPTGKPVPEYWWYKGISSTVEETHFLKVQAVKEIFFMHCTAHSSLSPTQSLIILI